jgi:hypothetical protein
MSPSDRIQKPKWRQSCVSPLVHIRTNTNSKAKFDLKTTYDVLCRFPIHSIKQTPQNSFDSIIISYAKIPKCQNNRSLASLLLDNLLRPRPLDDSFPTFNPLLKSTYTLINGKIIPNAHRVRIRAPDTPQLLQISFGIVCPR